MIIKEGYNGKQLEIKVRGRKYESAELWITQTGLPEEMSRYRETLSYCSLLELVELKREIDLAIMDITGLSED